MRIAAALLLIPALGGAQDSGPATFRAETRLVQVSVVARDANGPVRNLTKDDFSIVDRGKPRAIAVFSSSSSGAGARAAGKLPPNTFSNRLRVGSDAANGVTIILLDGMNTLNTSADSWNAVMDTLRTDNQSLAFARQQLVKFVKAIQPGDRVAIYSLGRTLKVLCDFTNDSVALEKILAAYRATPAVDGDVADPLPSNLPTVGNFNPAVDGGNRQAATAVNGTRAGVTMDALRSIADHAAGIAGRKNLVWLTGSIPFSGAAIARLVGRANIAVYPVDARGLATVYNPRFAEALGVSQMPMRDVAEQTGGRAFLNNNDLSGAVRNAIDDAAVTYTLGFYVGANELDGKFHELKIHVKDGGLDVRYPRGYYAGEDTSVAGSSGENSVDKMVTSPLESSEVHLLARVERVHPPSSFSVSATVDLKNIELRPEGDVLTGTVELYLIQQDSGGQVLDKFRDKMMLRLTRSQYAAYLKSGVFFRKIVAEKSNVATLRVVAGDPRTRRMGSLIIPASAIR